MTRRRVRGPNRLVINVPEVIATGLVGRGNRGYEFVEDDTAGDGQPEGDLTEKWTVAQLKAYADEHGVDLGEATKKADILAAIEAAASDADQD